MGVPRSVMTAASARTAARGSSTPVSYRCIRASPPAAAPQRARWPGCNRNLRACYFSPGPPAAKVRARTGPAGPGNATEAAMPKDRGGEELARLAEARDQGVPWRMWGPYLSERQWGTVREDYSENGDAWSYFSHDQARSRAYHWGEDGLAGVSDDKQRLCFALALWNGKDPILKERLFGLTNAEGRSEGRRVGRASRT